MKIAIDAADLCDRRVDGTRVYIKNILNYLGKIEKADSFFIYLKGRLNKELNFRRYANYFLKKSKAPFFWTQSKFPFEIRRDQPDVLWMPLQTVPFLIKRKTRVVVTIHDLAFRFFKNHFPLKDRLFLAIFTKLALKRADKVIAVSQNTKQDIIKEYGLPPEKITVIYHGYNDKIFNLGNARDDKEIGNIKKKYWIKGDYILYAGALQPRKNLEVLIKAFEKLKKIEDYNNLKLVLAGPKAWLCKDIYRRVKASANFGDIIFTGHYRTKDLPYLMGGAEVFVFPSLYEGFGIPVLEAMASGVPVICADNSSLPEVGGEAPQYFKAENYQELAETLRKVLGNKELKQKMISGGLEQTNKFSWEKCARETYRVLKVESL
ncbi:MAG: glycosyltransferase family 1 protein [Patescibacteria group bacterium]|nr:glycosyltransferase family 1 protein [Patescibacteria group bacterium]